MLPGGAPGAAERRVRRPAAAPPPGVANLEGELVLHLGAAGDARLRFSEGRDAFVLDLVLVPSATRGQGHGSALIARLLAIADALGKPVALTARPIGRSSAPALERLVRYYQTFGFVADQRGVSSVLMRRPARPSRAAWEVA
jgi:GNAT superfamily N-acetyltransferase